MSATTYIRTHIHNCLKTIFLHALDRMLGSALLCKYISILFNILFLAFTKSCTHSYVSISELSVYSKNLTFNTTFFFFLVQTRYGSTTCCLLIVLLYLLSHLFLLAITDYPNFDVELYFCVNA